MANNAPEIVLDADISPLRQKFREAAAELQKVGKSGEDAFERMTGPLGALQSKFIAVGALLAGGKVFAAAIAESAKLTSEANALSKALGISTTEAGAMNIALGDIYSSAEDYIGASQQLARQLRTNEGDLKAMGLQTRESNGDYRKMNDLMMDSIKVLAGYKEGTDRTLAAQTLFGKGAGEVGKFLKLNSDVIDAARQKQEELNLTVGVENVEANRAYKASMNDVGDVISGVKKTIGDAVMPVLTKLGDWFSSIGPVAVSVFKYAIGGLVAGFWILKHAVVVVWETVNAMVVSVAEPIRAIGEAIGKGLAGDFEGAKAALTGIPKEISTAWKTANKEIDESASEIDAKIRNLFGKPTATTPKAATGKGYKAPPDDDSKKGEASFMSTYEARLAEDKNAYEQKNALARYSKEQELAYWRELQDNYALTSKDRVAIAKRTATLELEIRRESAKDQRDLDTALLDSRKADGLAQIELDRQRAQFARGNGEISKAELIILEEQFARRKFEIEYQAMLERQEMLKADPSVTPAALARAKEDMLEIERRYQLQRGQLDQDKKKEGSAGGFFDDVGSSFQRAATTMMTSAQTLRQQMMAVFGSIYQSFVSNMIAKPLGEWIASHARMLAVKLGFLTAETTAQTASSATTAAVKGTEATVVVGANAAEAGSGAAASVASIPYVGPMLALAAMATVFAAVSALSGKRKSAAGGYDIPHGLNPVVQTHEEEMILPKKYANVIRGMAGGEGEGGGARGAGGDTHHHYNIQAWDSRDVGRFLQDNKRHIAGAMKSAHRDGFKS